MSNCLKRDISHDQGSDRDRSRGGHSRGGSSCLGRHLAPGRSAVASPDAQLPGRPVPAGSRHGHQPGGERGQPAVHAPAALDQRLHLRRTGGVTPPRRNTDAEANKPPVREFVAPTGDEFIF